MKLYLFSLLAGCLVGVIYGVINVRSPAPPVIALLGLLGILIGEQAVSFVKGRNLLEPAAFGQTVPSTKEKPAVLGRVKSAAPSQD